MEMIKTKLDMLNALQDIEIATSLLRVDGEEMDEDANAVDESYKKLKTTIDVLPKDSEEYKILKDYAEQGHDHSYFKKWTIEVIDIFKIERHGERERFTTWKANANRQLLWHGSRLTNFVGILSQGLRIAPPEAPKTGYRFGKGLYFADTISKSAHYCFTSKENPTGIMLLTEVALGKMNELLNDMYMETPQPGTDSTKAMGRTAPDPKEDTFLQVDGDKKIKVPKGKPIKTGIKSKCSHNEYIVYRVEQATIRYLFKVNFKWI